MVENFDEKKIEKKILHLFNKGETLTRNDIRKKVNLKENEYNDKKILNVIKKLLGDGILQIDEYNLMLLTTDEERKRRWREGKRKIRKIRLRKNLIKIGKKIIMDELYHSSFIKIYKIYPEDQILEILGDKLKINIEYSLFLDIIDYLNEEEFCFRKINAIMFQE